MIYFINSTNRLYEDRDLNKIYNILFEEGVFNSTKANLTLWSTQGDFAVKPNTGLDIKIAKGSILKNIPIRGKDESLLITLSEDEDLTVLGNSTGDIRADAVILRINKDIIDDDELDENASNVITFQIITGTSEVALTDGYIETFLDGDYFVRLADIFIPDGASSIAQSYISDTRILAKQKPSSSSRTEIINLISRTSNISNPINGDIWYENGTLKLKTESGIVDIQTNQFDFYSDGYSINNEDDSMIINNTGDIVNRHVLTGFFSSPNYGKNNLWQLFTVPYSEMGTLYFQKNDDNNTDYPVIVEICEIVDDYKKGTVIESKTFSALEWQNTPDFGFLEMSLNETYVQGETYGINIALTSWYSETDDEPELVLVTKTDSNLGECYYFQDMISGTDYYSAYSNNRTLSMKIQKKETVQLGTTSQEKLMQIFTSRGNSIKGFSFRRSADAGSPVGDINVAVYELDSNNEPTGDPLGEVTVAETLWDSVLTDSYVEVPLRLTVAYGIQYGVVISPDNISDVNYRTLWSSETIDSYTEGRLKIFDGTNWNAFNYDLIFKVKEGAENKIVMTNSDGYIDSELIQVTDSGISPSIFHQVLFLTGTDVKVKISPSGKEFIVMLFSTRQFTRYSLVGGIFKPQNTWSLSGADYWSFDYGKDDNTIVFVANDDALDICKLWVDNPKLLTGVVHSYTDTDMDWSESNTLSYGGVIYNKLTDKYLVYRNSTQVVTVDPVSFTTGSIYSLGINYSIALDITGWTIDNKLFNLNYKYTQTSDNVFTQSASGVPNINAYAWRLMPLKNDGLYLVLRNYLTHATTSSSSSTLEHTEVQLLAF